jgi:hypothetical protein
MRKFLFALSLLFGLCSTGPAKAQTIQNNFLLVSSGGQVQIQQINTGAAFTDCLGCGSRLIAWCSATCVLDAVVSKVAASNAEDITEFQVVRYTDGSFAAFNRLGYNISGADPVTVIYDWGPLSGGRDSLLNAMYNP